MALPAAQKSPANTFLFDRADSRVTACCCQPPVTAPHHQGPVLVRGLGRFMELKEMARRQQEEKAAVEAKVGRHCSMRLHNINAAVC